MSPKTTIEKTISTYRPRFSHDSDDVTIICAMYYKTRCFFTRHVKSHIYTHIGSNWDEYASLK